MFTNGICNTYTMANGHLDQLVKYGGGDNCALVYNETAWLFADVQECLRNRRGYISKPAAQMLILWDLFTRVHKDPSVKLLFICHSGGAIHVKNALEAAPQHIRDRIIVVAIAPGAIVPREICHNSYNYVSKNRDLVPLSDVEGMRKYGNQLIHLDPHPDAKRWDHDFRSPTFAGVLQKHIAKFKAENGG